MAPVWTRLGIALVVCADCVQAAHSEESPPPTIYYSTADYIAAYTPGDAERVVVIDEDVIGGTVIEMQLAPALGRIFWSSRLPLEDATRWSSNPDGTDIRGESSLPPGSTIGPEGLYAYYFDQASEQFARQSLDGSANELLGFGSRPATVSIRGTSIDPTGQWIYYTSERIDRPFVEEARDNFAILRGDVESGVVQQILVLDRFDRNPRLNFVFDPQNGLLHGHGFGPSFNSILESGIYQFSESPAAFLGEIGFEEGEGIFELFIIDPDAQEYYWIAPNCLPACEPLRKTAYGDISPPFMSRNHNSIPFENAFNFFIGNNEQFRELPRQLMSSPTFLVPEPSSQKLLVIELLGVLFVSWIRNRLEPSA